MSYFKQPLLLMFLGSPGSGKSYFAKAVADEMNAIRINGDSMRVAMFGSREETDRIYNSETRDILNSYVFGALNYVAEQIVQRGQDLVYDAHHNKRVDRQNLENLAQRHNALPVVVRVKTPHEVAFKRGISREERVDQRQLTEESMREVMARHQAATDEPTAEERVITIDGEAPFASQFQAFTEQLERMQ